MAGPPLISPVKAFHFVLFGQRGQFGTDRRFLPRECLVAQRDMVDQTLVLVSLPIADWQSLPYYGRSRRYEPR